MPPNAFIRKLLSESERLYCYMYEQVQNIRKLLQYLVQALTKITKHVINEIKIVKG